MQEEFEQIDARIRELDLKRFQPGGTHHFTAEDVTKGPGDILKKLCELYRHIRPIIEAIANFPLIPKTWRDAIRTFMNLLDTICPA
jgi:hypothetical protein